MKTGIWLLVKFAYKTLLRKLVKKAVESTDTEWDDKVLVMLDALFDYAE